MPHFRGIGHNEESDRRIGHNLEELARGPLSIRKISDNDKIATFSRPSGMYLNAAHKEIAQTNSHLLWLSHLKPVTGKNLTFVMQYVIKNLLF